MTVLSDARKAVADADFVARRALDAARQEAVTAGLDRELHDLAGAIVRVQGASAYCVGLVLRLLERQVAKAGRR